jgi:hypothetical protein
MTTIWTMTMADIDNILRFFDDMPDDWPTVVVNLIDALREYVRHDADSELDAQIEGWVMTKEQARKHAMHMQAIKLLLKELETYEVWCVEQIKRTG